MARAIRHRRLGSALLKGLLACALISVAIAGIVVGANLRTYQRVGAERPAGELRFTAIGYHQFNGVFTAPSGERSDFELRGDEWQLDARVLKWREFVNLLGADTAYRLDRISGRYTNIEDERSLPRTVYAMNRADRVDVWEFLQRHHSWLPGVDALYGSAAYLPLADGARFAVSVSPSGLVARPINGAGDSAVAAWH